MPAMLKCQEFKDSESDATKLKASKFLYVEKYEKKKG